MIGYGPPAFRIARPLRAERRKKDNAGAPYPAAPDGGESTFSRALADPGRVPPGPSSPRALGEQTCQLAQSGGGTARVNLGLPSGERVELRVSVRGGAVTVSATVTSAQAQRAVDGLQQQVARALADAGLRLHLFKVRVTSPGAGDRGTATARGARHDQEEDRSGEEQDQ
jgi:hypothetical protein